MRVPRPLFVGFVMALSPAAWAQVGEAAWRGEQDAYWAEIEGVFRDSVKSPLPPMDRAGCTGLQRFEADPDYWVQARCKPRQGKDFGMITTTDRRPVHRAVGTLHFTVQGRSMRLTVFQNRELVQRPEYAYHLILPFTDLTNGTETYGGGAVPGPEEAARARRAPGLRSGLQPLLCLWGSLRLPGASPGEPPGSGDRGRREGSGGPLTGVQRRNLPAVPA
jgi:hypothetical protein